jgi:hypothetical protein
MRRLLAIALIMLSMVLSAISCKLAPASFNPATATTKPVQTPTSTVGPNQLIEVTNRIFFDYSGNGIQEYGEPAIPDIRLIYQPGNISCLTNEGGLGTVKVPAGSYTISIDDSSNKFQYILNSVSEITDIGDGLNVDIISKGEEISIPLAQGFLTWPFLEGVNYEMIYFFKPEDPAIDPLSVCEGGT